MLHGLYLTMCHVYYHGTFLAAWTSSSHACHTHTINEGCVKEIVIIGHNFIRFGLGSIYHVMSKYIVRVYIRTCVHACMINMSNLKTT